MKDKLKEIFELQTKLQERVAGDINSLVHNQDYINLNLLACYDELGEIMRETAWKNPNKIKYGWKKGQELNKENFKEEIIDLWHFLINLTISSGMNEDELFNRYCSKNKENHNRQDNNY